MKISVIKNTNFVFLWIGNFISHTGDAIYAFALPWLLLELTGSAFRTAIVTMAAYLPALIFGLLAGSIVDKYDRKWIMIISDLIRAILVFVIPASMLLGLLSPILIGVITFGLSIFATFFYPARDSLIPHITSRSELTIANSAISVSSQLSQLLGPIIAGAGFAMFGIIHLFTADAMFYIISFFLISAINTQKNSINNIHKSSQMQHIIVGINYVRANTALRILLILTFVNNLFIMGPTIIGLPVFVKEILHGNFFHYMLLQTSMATGMIIGALLVWYLEKYINPIRILLCGIVLDGLTYSLLYFVSSYFVAMTVLFIHGIGIPLITVSRTNIIQITVPNQFRGRLFAMIYMAVMGTTAFSIGLTGLALELINGNVLFLIIGICAASCVLIGFYYKELLQIIS